MPTQGNFDDSNVSKLYDIGLILLETYKGAKTHHQMQCRNCEHTWIATPLSKTQAFKKYGFNGCPMCHERRRTEASMDNIKSVIKQVSDLGYDILENFDGSSINDHTIKTLVRRRECGHEWKSVLRNILRCKAECPICNVEVKRLRCNANSAAIVEEFRKTAPAWKVYKQTVYTLTLKAYRQNKSTINPNNLPLGLAGTMGAYQVDHKVPVRWCFDHNVPPDVCADPSNLQMLGWSENISARDRIKPGTPVPAIFSYLREVLDVAELFES